MTRILLTLLLASAFTTNVDAGVLTGRVKVTRGGEAVQAKPVVYLDSVPKAAAGKKATVVQKHRKFVPKVLVVTKGTRVFFSNQDTYKHNVFSNTRGSRFDLGQNNPGTTKSIVFKNLGVVKVHCNIHPGMSATVLVLADDYWVRTDKNGNFALNNVPPGTYTLFVWLPNSVPSRRKVTVRAGKNKPVSLKITAGGVPPTVPPTSYGYP